MVKKYFVLLLCCIVTSLEAFGQSFDKNERQSGGMDLQPQKQQQQTQQILSTPIQEGPVDPKEYLVGPGDIFNISIWSAVPLNFQVPVTPEGTVIIPTVGEISISGFTLDSAKNYALKEIKKKYLSGIPSFTLLQPRTFSVTMRGAVKMEQTFFVQATQRVSSVVNHLDKEDRRDTTVAQRKIHIHHKNGIISIADIEKYYATLNTSYNPLLRDGDIIVVPYANLSRDFVSVYGEVNKGGRYEFVEGDSLTSLVKIARGTSAMADSDNIVITRIDEQQHASTIKTSLRKIVSGNENDIVLQRGDRIVVYPQYTQLRDAKVEVNGEVKFPGYYPISRDSTYLSEVIALAGGVTDRASLANSQLFRRSVNANEIQVERMESGRGGITPDDSAYYYLETDIRINRELVVTDFVQIIEKKNRAKDILLRDGDLINISSRKKTVYVFGQVVSPGHILFEQGKNFNQYIQQAGGVTDDARTGDIKIIKASTRQWLDPEQTTIEEGDYVWVPKEPYRPFAYYMNVYGQLFSIIATVVSLAVLVTR